MNNYDMKTMIDGLFGAEPAPVQHKVQREARLQQECVRWFRLQYPHLLLFHIPNGGRRNAKEAAHFKSEGVVAGIPDLFLASARNSHHGLFIEMKAGRNTESRRQVEVRKQLESQGYLCAVCRTFDEFRETVSDYLMG